VPSTSKAFADAERLVESGRDYRNIYFGMMAQTMFQHSVLAGLDLVPLPFPK
jgi:hypothetical protein